MLTRELLQAQSAEIKALQPIQYKDYGTADVLASHHSFLVDLFQELRSFDQNIDFYTTIDLAFMSYIGEHPSCSQKILENYQNLQRLFLTIKGCFNAIDTQQEISQRLCDLEISCWAKKP